MIDLLTLNIKFKVYQTGLVFCPVLLKLIWEMTPPTTNVSKIWGYLQLYNHQNNLILAHFHQPKDKSYVY